VFEKLEELARLPAMEEGLDGIDKQRRLESIIGGLFGLFATPVDSDVAFHREDPYRVLALTETERRIKVGPMTAPSASHATIFLARGVLAALARMPAKRSLGPLRRVRKALHTTTKPKPGARSCESVLAWIATELPPESLESVYDSVLGEMQLARRFLKGEGDTPNRVVSHHSEAIRKILDKNGELGKYARLVLVALHVWETEGPKSELTRDALVLQVKALQRRVGMQESCALSTVAKQYAGLKPLGLIHQPPYEEARLSCEGRAWVLKSDLFKRDMEN